MDINTLRGIATIIVMLGFLGLVFWVYIVKSKKDFDDAANLPFENDTETEADGTSDSSEESEEDSERS